MSLEELYETDMAQYQELRGVAIASLEAMNQIDPNKARELIQELTTFSTEGSRKCVEVLRAGLREEVWVEKEREI
jgi:hypothetical protein